MYVRNAKTANFVFPTELKRFLENAKKQKNAKKRKKTQKNAQNAQNAQIPKITQYPTF
jgi:hypothetical protein